MMIPASYVYPWLQDAAAHYPRRARFPGLASLRPAVGGAALGSLATILVMLLVA